MSAAEDLLAFQLKACGVFDFEREAPIAGGRRFRADFHFYNAEYPERQLVVEVEGGAFIQGRHARGAGMRNDCVKSALIAAMPARLIRVLPEHVKSGEALQWILTALGRQH